MIDIDYYRLLSIIGLSINYVWHRRNLDYLCDEGYIGVNSAIYVSRRLSGSPFLLYVSFPGSYLSPYIHSQVESLEFFFFFNLLINFWEFLLFLGLLIISDLRKSSAVCGNTVSYFSDLQCQCLSVFFTHCRSLICHKTMLLAFAIVLFAGLANSAQPNDQGIGKTNPFYCSYVHIFGAVWNVQELRHVDFHFTSDVLHTISIL